MKEEVPPLVVSAYLIVRSDGNLRIVKNARLALDEVAFPLTVEIPRTWGRVQTTSITLTMPEPPETRVLVGPPEVEE